MSKLSARLNLIQHPLADEFRQRVESISGLSVGAYHQELHKVCSLCASRYRGAQKARLNNWADPKAQRRVQVLNLILTLLRQEFAEPTGGSIIESRRPKEVQ